MNHVNAPSFPPSTTLVERLLTPFRRFANTAPAGGIVLLIATAVALVWANSPWAEAYHHLWETPLRIGIGGWSAQWTAHHFINDGLMAVFFFVVGLEIKREMVAGELKSARTAALPMIAALGGMIVPAAIYALLNRNGAGLRGWGIPMATDIAFALGVLALLGSRVPVGLKVFLSALAIVDDIGAILVIALFYSAGVNWAALTAVAVILLTSAGANAAGIRNPWAYGIIGLFLWGAVLMSGIHATVAGVLLAMTIPVRTRVNEAVFLREARRTLAEFDAAAVLTANDPDTTVLSNTDHHTALEELEDLVTDARPPLIKMEHALDGIVAFVIIPLFALANAGLALDANALGGAFASPIAVGAILGLMIGKPLGITGLSWLAVRAGIASLPAGVNWRMLSGAGVLGGIGFTMALFIAGLAFQDAALLDAAKLGVFAASAITGVAGWIWLKAALPKGPTTDAG